MASPTGSPPPHAVLPPEDQPPVSERTISRPRGLLVAGTLALITLAIIGYVGLSTEDAADAPTVLDPHAPQPPAERPDSAIAPLGAAAPTEAFELFDGRSATLTDYTGTPLVVNFWGSWCPPCLVEMPELEQLHQRLDGQVQFLGLNVNDRRSRALELVERTGVTYELGWDTDGELLRAFGGVQMPVTAFIDAQGQVVEVVGGARTGAQLQAHIDQLVP